MKKDISLLLADSLKDSLKELGLFADIKEELYLDIPTDMRFGDLSSNAAMKLASILKKSPRQVASEIVEKLKTKLDKPGLKEYVREVKIEGAGFINFFLSNDYFYVQLKQILEKGADYFKSDIGKGLPVLLEFVSANPTGSLSVAHARQAAVGDILANVLNLLGYKVTREYYLNDEGNQINILGKSVGLRRKELAGERIEFPEDHYQGEYIYDIAKAALEAKIKDEDLGDFAGNYILDIIKKELSDFGVDFDVWYSQKSLREKGKIEKAFALFEKKGFLYKEDGALWFKSTQFGDDKDRVVIKSDGAHTYLAPDIAYHEDKYKRGFKMLINLWGPDHHGYIHRLKASVAALGENPDSLHILIVQLATIYRAGKIVHMSTRRGQYITLQEVLDEVGSDAARYFFIMRKISSHLDFDLEIAKKQTPENPVFYVQYAHARISNILKNTPEHIKYSDADLSLLKEKEEILLIKKIYQFRDALNVCLKTLDPYVLTCYLGELSEAFHKFYDLHRVLGADNALSTARLALIKAAQIAIAAGLDLVGVTRPEKM